MRICFFKEYFLFPGRVFKLPCTEPAGAIVNQVKAWSQKKCSDSQEKCNYEVNATSLQLFSVTS